MTADPNQEISKQVKPVFRPDYQDDLIKFVDDPETINKAVEGSMDKRAKVLDDSRELREAIAVNMGLYYRKSDDKWLRETHINGRYIGVEDMTPELDTIFKLALAYTANKQRQLLEWVEQNLPTRKGGAAIGRNYWTGVAKGNNDVLDEIEQTLKNKKEL